jgi:hypothetical protein
MAEAEMVRYAGGVALLDAPHSIPTTYAAWLRAKKTSVIGTVPQERCCANKTCTEIQFTN